MTWGRTREQGKMAHMDDSGKRADWPIVVGMFFALLGAAVAVYIGGYFALSEILDSGPAYRDRTFDNRLLAAIYRPAALAEGWIRGEVVVTSHWERAD